MYIHIYIAARGCLHNAPTLYLTPLHCIKPPTLYLIPLHCIKPPTLYDRSCALLSAALLHHDRHPAVRPRGHYLALCEQGGYGVLPTRGAEARYVGLIHIIV
jgi:hypothetical protein